MLPLLESLQRQGLEGLLRALNFGIERDERLHAQLKGLAGKRLSIRFDVPGPFQGLAFNWTLAADGLLEDWAARPPEMFSQRTTSPAASSAPAGRSVSTADNDSQPDVCLAITSDFFSAAVDQALFARPGAASSPVMKGIRIEGDASVAEQLGPLVGLIREWLAPLQQAVGKSPLVTLAQQLVHYAAHEGRLVVNRDALAYHQLALRQFRDALDRFDKRLDRYSATKSL